MRSRAHCHEEGSAWGAQNRAANFRDPPVNTKRRGESRRRFGFLGGFFQGRAPSRPGPRVLYPYPPRSPPTAPLSISRPDSRALCSASGRIVVLLRAFFNTCLKRVPLASGDFGDESLLPARSPAGLRLNSLWMRPEAALFNKGLWVNNLVRFGGRETNG